MDKPEITYSWGDPREPEWHDGVRIFSILYQDNQRKLRFKVLPKKSGNKIIGWRVLPPHDIKVSFKGDKAYLETCDSVVNYLKTNDFSADYTLRSVEFQSVMLDLSELPGWFSTQHSLFQKKYTRKLRYIPDLTTLLMSLVGFFVILLHQHSSGGMFSTQSVCSLLFGLGVTVLLRLILRIKRSYRNMLFLLRFHATNLRLEAIKLLVRLHIVQYLITFSLGVGLILYATAHI